MNFKEQIEADNRAFINPTEFGEVRAINGRTMNVVIDNISSTPGGSTDKPGLYAVQMVIYVTAEQFGKKPKSGDEIILDNKVRYTVSGDVSNDCGILTIPIRRQRV